jgi:hypothetical protein
VPCRRSSYKARHNLGDRVCPNVISQNAEWLFIKFGIKVLKEISAVSLILAHIIQTWPLLSTKLKPTFNVYLKERPFMHFIKYK